MTETVTEIETCAVCKKPEDECRCCSDCLVHIEDHCTDCENCDCTCGENECGECGCDPCECED